MAKFFILLQKYIKILIMVKENIKSNYPAQMAESSPAPPKKLFGVSRSVLKWIALITMLIDHIGAIIGYATFSSWQIPWLYDVLRVIGRLSFPIFAFFIAEGWHYTKNRKKYFLLLLIFAIISQPIYYFALNTSVFALNILFTF